MIVPPEVAIGALGSIRVCVGNDWKTVFKDWRSKHKEVYSFLKFFSLRFEFVNFDSVNLLFLPKS